MSRPGERGAEDRKLKGKQRIRGHRMSECRHEARRRSHTKSTAVNGSEVVSDVRREIASTEAGSENKRRCRSRWSKHVGAAPCAFSQRHSLPRHSLPHHASRSARTEWLSDAHRTAISVGRPNLGRFGNRYPQLRKGQSHGSIRVGILLRPYNISCPPKSRHGPPNYMHHRSRHHGVVCNDI